MEQSAHEETIRELKTQWKTMWDERIDDKTRAEGIANVDYSMLFVEKGTVIFATRDFKPLNFKEILRLHGVENVKYFDSPQPSVGGYRKFARKVLNKQKRIRKLKAIESESSPKRKKVQTQMLKKKGWLHYKIK